MNSHQKENVDKLKKILKGKVSHDQNGLNPNQFRIYCDRSDIERIYYVVTIGEEEEEK